MNAASGCSICLESFNLTSEICTTPCGHVFHCHCIRRWLQRGNPYCPLCKQNCENITRLHFSAANEENDLESENLRKARELRLESDNRRLRNELLHSLFAGSGAPVFGGSSAPVFGGAAPVFGGSSAPLFGGAASISNPTASFTASPGTSTGSGGLFSTKSPTQQTGSTPAVSEPKSETEVRSAEAVQFTANPQVGASALGTTPEPVGHSLESLLRPRIDRGPRSTQTPIVWGQPTGSSSASQTGSATGTQATTAPTVPQLGGRRIARARRRLGPQSGSGMSRGAKPP